MIQDWWPFNDIFDKFDRVTSRTTLEAPVVNDMGMDDRLVMAEAVKFIEEQGRRQREEGEEGGAPPPFVMVLMWCVGWDGWMDEWLYVGVVLAWDFGWVVDDVWPHVQFPPEPPHTHTCTGTTCTAPS